MSQMPTFKRWFALVVAPIGLYVIFIVFKILNKPNRPVVVLNTKGMPQTLKFSPDGTILVAGEETYFPRLRWWRWKSHELLHEVITKHDAGITDIAFTNNGQRFITWGFNDAWMRTWSVGSGAQISKKCLPYSSLKTIRPAKQVFSKDSELEASTRAGIVYIRHRKDQKPVITIQTYETQFDVLAISPDKRWLAGSARRDSFKGTRIYIWELSALKP